MAVDDGRCVVKRWLAYLATRDGLNWYWYTGDTSFHKDNLAGNLNPWSAS